MDEYTKQTIERIKELMADEREVFYQEDRKNNDVVLRGIIIQNNESNISPVFDVGNYEKQGCTPQEAALKILKRFREIKEQEIPFDVSCLGYFKEIKDMIRFKVINKEANKIMLENVPYYDMAGDICVAYYLDIGNNATITIKDFLLDLWNISKEELHKTALDNMKNFYPVSFQTMSEVMVDMMIRDNINEMKMHFGMNGLSDNEFKKVLEAELDEERLIPMYVLRNNILFGASVLLYEDVLNEVHKKIGDYFILPSSIHEIIVIPNSADIEIDTIKSMIKDVNTEEVREEERLSDELFFYNGKELVLVDDDRGLHRTVPNLDYDER